MTVDATLDPYLLGWRAQAACRGQVQRWQAVAVGRRTIRAAQVACLACPVYTQCRTWVLSQDPDPCPWHVVAAMTPGDRVYAYRPPRRAVAHV